MQWFDFYIVVCKLVIFTTLVLNRKLATCHENKIHVSYGSHREQTMDIYLPENPSKLMSKAIVLIHGGAWIEGHKIDMIEFLAFIKESFPEYLIANMNYQLGNAMSPGYPKQLNDIKKALGFIESEYNIIQPQFALLGVSAGAHLALLHAYGFDKRSNVKTVCNVVGPTDFEDPKIKNSLFYQAALTSLVGPHTHFLKPKIYRETSPVTYITANSVPTISFYGVNDPLVPVSQGRRLVKKLNDSEVPYKYFEVMGGHYLDWSLEDRHKLKTETTEFFNKYFK